jgi:hypothetical protein
VALQAQGTQACRQQGLWGLLVSTCYQCCCMPGRPNLCLWAVGVLGVVCQMWTFMSHRSCCSYGRTKSVSNKSLGACLPEGLLGVQYNGVAGMGELNLLVCIFCYS